MHVKVPFFVADVIMVAEVLPLGNVKEFQLYRVDKIGGLMKNKVTTLKKTEVQKAPQL